MNIHCKFITSLLKIIIFKCFFDYLRKKFYICIVLAQVVKLVDTPL